MVGRTKPHRGVLLLVVLSLLVLFLLVGLSFMVSAGQFNRLAKSAARTDNTGMPGSKLADAALYQILRGTSNPYSAIRGHSLLEDLYGRDYIIIQATDIIQNYQSSEHQIQRLRFDAAGIQQLGHRLPEDATSGPQELRDDYYNGCVLTFLNGTAKGISTRVLAYKPQHPGGAFLLIKGVNVNSSPPIAPDNQSLRFIINGRPFNGTGAGYNPQTGALDNGQAELGVPLAFLPNYKSYREIANGALAPFLDVPARNVAYGGLDESWDGFDYQNFFMAKGIDRAQMRSIATLHEEILEQSQSGSTIAPEIQQMVSYLRNTGGTTPSFHRPYLFEHLRQKLSPLLFNGSEAVSGFKQAIVARPTREHHPAFTGSNPEFSSDADGDGIADGWTNGPWDVDCDGDGIRDSIWIDAGLSLVAGKDGRMYKPLVAAHILDMDGRLNLNAHDGVSRNLASSMGTPLTTSIGVIPIARGALSIDASDASAFGLGFGPADISLPVASNMLHARYAGKRRSASVLTESPFDESLVPVPGAGRAEVDPTNPSYSDDDFFCGPPLPRAPDYFIGLRDDVHKTNYGNYEDQSNLPGLQTSVDTGFGSPSDYHARLVPYLDAHGNTIWTSHRDWIGKFDNLDDPYEINLLQTDTHDRPFDLSDLEAIQRVDIAYEQSRAIGLFEANRSDTNISQYTTHSFSIPVPPAIPSGLHRGTAGGDGLKRNLRELFAARIQRVSGTDPATAFAQAARIMAPELLRGERIDINRVLVPNPRPAGETPTLAELAQRQLILAEKERFGRHLYNLMMLISEQEPGTGFVPQLPGANPTERQVSHIRRLAQWAVNVVDFGDADSVMTRMFYDVNPFNQWEPFSPLDGSLKQPGQGDNDQHLQDLGTVWGMEHPEMLLTETLAFHDRRAADSEEGMTLEDGDEDLDSTMEPQGAAFFELYCARGQRPVGFDRLRTVSSRAPEDLYDNQGQLNLSKHLPNSQKPVWRLAISEITTDNEGTPLKLLHSGKAALNTFEPSDLGLELKRFVWFSNQAPEGGDGIEEHSDNTYFNKWNRTENVVEPGSYFVVGPGSRIDDKLRVTTDVGLTRGGDPTPQSVGLWVSDVRVNGTRLRPSGGKSFWMVADLWGPKHVGCSVSEPVGGYDRPRSDKPLDSISSADAEEAPIAGDLLATGTQIDFRTVFLQRLADPNQPWHAADNPYRTIDWMPIDLTVFNSLYDGPDDPDDPDPNKPLTEFASREKSGVKQTLHPKPPNPEADFFNIWSALTALAPRIATPQNEPFEDRAPGEAIQANEIPVQGHAPIRDKLSKSANTNVVHSLGWLNRSFDYVGVFGDGVGHYITNPNFNDEPFREAPRGAVDPTAALPIGIDPNPPSSSTVIPGALTTNYATTFPSFVWHNRPYANPYELMLVPASSSGSRSAEYTISQPFTPYKQQMPVNPTTESLAYRGAFGHLLNFFHSSKGTKNETPNELGGNYFRLFDFVTVPSRFRGTKSSYQFRDRETGQFVGSNLPVWSELLWGQDSPINIADAAATNLGMSINPATVSEFREPGKVNINTAPLRIWKQLGFNSLIGSWKTPGTIPTQSDLFELSMAGGYPLIRTDNETALADSPLVRARYPNGLHPAEYPNPLRCGMGADLIARLPTNVPLPPAVDATMLRSADPLQSVNRQPALAQYELPPPTTASQFRAYTLQNRKTNAYFRFRDLAKLGNSLTSQSNVYAVWITIGYFEVEPNVNEETGEVFHVDYAHPDGYRFGIEMGSDLGQVTRHRAFYVIDRSVPVAFEPGKNHNVDKAILVRRHLD